jgi:hypothetical protein
VPRPSPEPSDSDSGAGDDGVDNGDDAGNRQERLSCGDETRFPGHRPRRVGRRFRSPGREADRALGEVIRRSFRRAGPRNAPSIDSLVRGPGYLELRPGPGTNSTSSRRRWSLRFGISAAITGFLSLFVRASIGGFSLQ